MHPAFVEEFYMSENFDALQYRQHIAMSGFYVTGMGFAFNAVT